MDQDCNTGLCLGMNISIGTTTRAEDQKYAPRRPVNGAAPLQLDLFPLTSVLPPDPSSSALLPASGTLPWEKTSPGNDGGCDGSRSAEEAMDAIRPVPVSRRFDVNKFPPSCYSNKEASAINVSSSNSTVDSNAINSKSGYAMDSKRKLVATQELDHERACSRVLSDVKEKGRAKKKVRLSKDQWALLQESFSKDSTPELNQKKALARQLNLRTKQVKVWFQNRRARTKLKQTEMDYELLKRCNESLTDENRKLQTELQELRSLKLASPLMPATTLTVCPCCERLASARQ